MALFAGSSATAQWEYDDDADTLYLSFGQPRPATGLDIGEGIVVRFDEKAKVVVGLTIVGVGRRLEQYVKEKG
jgi:uncharacterized protein YuzE